MNVIFFWNLNILFNYILVWLGTKERKPKSKRGSIFRMQKPKLSQGSLRYFLFFPKYLFIHANASFMTFNFFSIFLCEIHCDGIGISICFDYPIDLIIGNSILFLWDNQEYIYIYIYIICIKFKQPFHWNLMTVL